MQLPWTRFGACILALACVAGASRAQEQSSEITLRDALLRVAQRNPELRALDLELRALDARTGQAALRPAPELSLEVENFAGSGEFQGLGAAEITFALSQLIELGDKRRLRVDAAQAQRTLAGSEADIRRVDLAAETLRRFVRVAGDQDELALAQRATELTSRTLAAVEQRVRAARSPIAELHRARVAQDRAQLEARHAEHALRASRRQLAALWGDSEPAFSRVATPLYTLPAVEEFAALERRMGESAYTRRYVSQARLQDTELRLARSTRTADFSIGAGVRRLQASDDTTGVLTFSMPLGARARGAAAVRESEIRRERVDADREADLVEARARLFDFYQELLHARSETEQLRERVLPEMEEALRQTEYAYERGRYSYLELVDAQQALVEVNRALIEAAVRYHTLLAEIESLTGQPLAASGTPERSTS